MPKVIHRQVLFAKKETTYGSDPTPTESANAIIAINPRVKEVFQAAERNLSLKTYSKKASLAGMKMIEVTFQTEIFGSGSVGTAPRVGALFQACGFSETVAASSVTYAPASSPISSCTLYFYLDGRRHKILGAVGNVKLTLQAGQIGLAEWTMQGLYADPTDTALPSPTYESTTPPVCKAGTLSVNAVTSLIAEKIEIDMANVISQRPSLSSSNALAGLFITSRKPNLSFDPEMVNISDYDWRADVLASPRAFSYVLGATAGNILTLSAPKFNAVDIEYGDRDGIAIETIKGELASNSDAGDDELTLVYT